MASTIANISSQNITSPDPTSRCSLLNLPLELFELIIHALSSPDAHILALCNHTLYNSDLIWRQAMKEPFLVTERPLSPIPPGWSSTACWPQPPPPPTLRRPWLSFVRFLKRYPVKASWVRKLALPRRSTLNSFVPFSKYLPNIEAIDLRVLAGRNYQHSLECKGRRNRKGWRRSARLREKSSDISRGDVEETL
ncbi:hypothetical protein Vi05172_g6305 [Venturia inaequalis]|nr:hypothetical protein Vi05172_g6305 [Venturia inaequalis]